MKILPRRVDFAEGYRVRVRSALHSGDGQLLSLSEGGCYIQTRMVLLPQAQLRLSLEIPELSRITNLEAVVAWENRGGERPSGLPEGYGMRFIKISPEANEAIHWLMKKDAPKPKKAPNETQTFEIEDLRSRLKRLEQQLSRTAPGVRTQEAIDAVTNPNTKKRAAALIEEEAARAEREAREKAEAAAEAPAAKSESEPDEIDDFKQRSGPPYPLRPKPINKLVPESPGVYMLSYDRTMDSRVGRADRDLREALTDFVGEYAFFHFEVIGSQKERYERECELYHRMGGDRGQLDNTEHPSPPPGPKLECPVCQEARAHESA